MSSYLCDCEIADKVFMPCGASSAIGRTGLFCAERSARHRSDDSTGRHSIVVPAGCAATTGLGYRACSSGSEDADGA